MAAGADFEIWSEILGTNWMKMAPKIAPGIDARPPTTTPTSRKIDSVTVKLSGDTKATAIAPSAPATPVKPADTPNASDLNIGRLMPIAVAAIGWSRMAISARPTRPRNRFHASKNMMAVASSVKKYSQRSGLKGWPNRLNSNGASGLVSTMPCTPPVQPSIFLYLSSCGTASASAKVASAR